ncbi:MAG: dihydropteroate synthase [Oscillospiraceae bacterium]|nr:dihydropteroate synthase [Oscillospiraceae bacterium]
MILIGEKINSSIPKTQEMMKSNDYEGIASVIKLQEKWGADYIDLNTGVFTDEAERLKSLIKLTLENTSENTGIMLDSASPDTLLKTINLTGNRKLIINSVTLTIRFSEIIPEFKKIIESGREAYVVAMPIEKRTPSTIEERLKNVDSVVKKLHDAGIEDKNVFLDVLAETVAVEDNAAVKLFDTLKYVKSKYPEIKTVCGMSNISFGLPKRIKINCAVVAIANSLGLDAAICDVTSAEFMTAFRASEMLCGRDEYCMGYIDFLRDNGL